LGNLQLFLACVAIWGSTWLAITFQLGRVAPEASVFYRFLLAAVLLFAFCKLRRLPLRFDARQHAWLALLGLTMFSIGYILVYYAEQHVVSGLVAVGYSASPLLALVGMRIFFRTPMSPRLIAGSILGMAGIALVYSPEFAALQGNRATAVGALYTALAVVLSTLGAMVAHRNQQAGLPLWQSMAWAMFHGALIALAVTLGVGETLAFEASWPYVLSLAYLAVFGSIVAFAGYLTLLRRVGATRAGYIGVMVPIVALVISSIFEHFRWHAVTVAGIGVTVLGNVIILRRK
jgi:drug/metabolite transporter (DMT)-like permease